MFVRIDDGLITGCSSMGQNPAVGGQNAGLPAARAGRSSTGWSCATCTRPRPPRFWKDAPEVRRGELKPEEIATEVFLLPAATHIEKEGCFTNTERLLQWHDKALDPPGDCRSDLWFMDHLFKRVRAHYAELDRRSRLADPAPDLGLPEHGRHAEPSADDVLREINGYDLTTGELVPGFAELRPTTATACGCWIYSGVYADGVNQARRREPGDLAKPGGWVAPEWGWAWPANRRVLYSRASADLDGRPWSERKRYVWWDGEQALDRLRRAGLPGRQAAGLRRPARRQGHGRDLRQRPVHHAGRRPRLAVLARRPARRPAADALRAARVAGRQPPLPAHRREPGGAALGPRRQPAGRHRRPALAVRRDHVPPHRAPHGRRHVALAAVARRAAAGDVRRDRPGARARARDRGRRLDDDQLAARGDRGARQGHRPDQAAAARRPPRAPGRPALALGLRRPVAGRVRERHQPAVGRPERVDPGVEGVRLPGPRGPLAGRHREARRRARAPPGVAPNRDHPAEHRPHR